MLAFKARPRKDPALSAQLSPSQRRMMRTLREAREATQRALRGKQGDVIRLLLHAPVTQIVRAVPTDAWINMQAEIQAELQAELIDAGRRVKLPPIQKATIAYRFDDARPEAAAWAAKEAGTLIQNITNDQLAFVRDVVSRASMGEFTPMQAAQVFRQMEDGMGLTVQQSEWVENFRQRRITDEMARGRTYEEAEARSAKSTQRYADRVYRYRTETIARTEIMRASNEGRNQAWQQGIEGGWIAPDSLKKWSVELDGRECSICRPLGDLPPIPINASFPSGDPPVHPNCRCTVVLTDEIPADLLSMTDDELEAEISRLLDERIQAPTAGLGMPFIMNPPNYQRETMSFAEGDALFEGKADPGYLASHLRRRFGEVVEQDVVVYISGDRLAGVVESGAIKNVFEVGNRAPGYMNTRMRVETDFGVPEDVPPRDRPVYGAIGGYKSAEAYGDFEFILKDDVKRRATFSVGDTFGGVTPVSAESVRRGTASLDDLARATPGSQIGSLRNFLDVEEVDYEIGEFGYWEAQVYGGVTLDDVSAVRVNPRHTLIDEDRRLLTMLKEKGVDVIE